MLLWVPTSVRKLYSEAMPWSALAGSLVEWSTQGMALIRLVDLAVVETNPAFRRLFAVEPGSTTYFESLFVEASDAADLEARFAAGAAEYHATLPMWRTGHQRVHCELVAHRVGEHLAVLLQDRTQEVQARADWLRLRRLRSLLPLGGGLVHELNNVFGLVHGMTDLLRHRSPTDRDAETLQRLDKAAHRGSRLVQLVGELILASTTQRQRVRLADVIEDVVWLFAKTAAHGRIALEVGPVDEQATVRVVPQELSHALLRLLNFLRRNGGDRLQLQVEQRRADARDPTLANRRLAVVTIAARGVAAAMDVTGWSVEGGPGIEQFLGLSEHGQDLAVAGIATRFAGGDLRLLAAEADDVRFELFLPLAP
jgi:nitrogen-specific signal transduction histidine kinase